MDTTTPPAPRGALRAGFTIVEAMIAITVLTVALFAVVSAMATSNQTARLAQTRDLAVSSIIRRIEEIQAMGVGPAFTAFKTPVTTTVVGLTNAQGSSAVLTVEINRLRPDGTLAVTTIGTGTVTIPQITYTSVRGGVTRTTVLPLTVVDVSSTSLPLVVSVVWETDGSLVSIRVPYTHISR